MLNMQGFIKRFSGRKAGQIIRTDTCAWPVEESMKGIF